jgi:hypothetical protein
VGSNPTPSASQSRKFLIVHGDTLKGSIFRPQWRGFALKVDTFAGSLCEELLSQPRSPI